jgi:hypothetical protein
MTVEIYSSCSSQDLEPRQMSQWVGLSWTVNNSLCIIAIIMVIIVCSVSNISNSFIASLSTVEYPLIPPNKLKLKPVLIYSASRGYHYRTHFEITEGQSLINALELKLADSRIGIRTKSIICNEVPFLKWIHWSHWAFPPEVSCHMIFLLQTNLSQVKLEQHQNNFWIASGVFFSAQLALLSGLYLLSNNILCAVQTVHLNIAYCYVNLWNLRMFCNKRDLNNKRNNPLSTDLDCSRIIAEFVIACSLGWSVGWFRGK